MTQAKSFTYLIGGIAVGIALVVACSDDSPGDVDAADAACNCPAAEPPLAGRITRVRADNNLSPGGTGGAAVGCPAGAIALGGSCEVATTDTNVVLLSSRFTPGSPEGYRCDWSTVNATMARTGTAEVVCLTPAP
ncbi:MAG: hypothetical protein IPH44_01265 [Myxococcales bacterium]|nr:hypothetical protein [Myxococcales bacterium]MBK7197944.1 hypothetical protein [Myxococcales bacterium]